MPKLLKGPVVAEAVYDQCRKDLEFCLAQGVRPGLAVVLVGDDPASRVYIRKKDEQCRELGLHSLKIELPADTTEAELIRRVEELNLDPAIHGILVQSPPPPHINESRVVRSIDPAKDVDGFHPENVARLCLEDDRALVPCTPLGCQKILHHYQIPVEGAHVVVVGRSMIVGKPLALLLMQNREGGNATVTVAHSRTRDLPSVARSADILVAAVGRPGFITADHVKPGAVVIDVGINRVEDAESPRGYRLAGDVDFEAVKDICSAITPVPGGVGPMTIAMLMQNTLLACKNGLRQGRE